MTIESLSLLKPELKSALTEALYNEIVSNTNSYYYFIGKTLDWLPSPEEIESPQVTRAYENETREKIIFLKKVTSADIAFTIPRYDWHSGEVYDMFDDQMGKRVVINVNPVSANFSALTGSFDLSEIGVGWLVEGSGIEEETYITNLTETTMTLSKRTIGNVSTVSIINTGYYGAKSLDKAKFYAVTNDRNVYKCLFNNNRQPSTVKPFSTTHEPIATADGYIWKFMYTIPGSLQNKFTSPSNIPVTTSVKSGYYSRGAITSTTINNYGMDYSQGDFIVVTGDGHLAENTYKILGVVINNAGSGYDSLDLPQLTVSAPYDAVTFTPNFLYLVGQYVQYDSRIYEVKQGGVTGSEPPTHTSSVPVPNGTTAMQFVGLTLSATPVITNSSISSVPLSGIVAYVNLEVLGSGYSAESLPAVTITGNGFDAEAVANVSAEGKITSITLTNRGYNYTNAVVSIEAPFVQDVIWSSEGSVDENDIVRAFSRFYRVVSTGSGQELGLSMPTHLSGIEENGDVELEFIGEAASATAEIYYGYGYSTVPTITVEPPVEEDLEWQANTNVSIGDIVKVDSRFYTVSFTLLGTEPPTHTEGTEVNGNCSLQYTSETIGADVEWSSKGEVLLDNIVQFGDNLYRVTVVNPQLGLNEPTHLEGTEKNDFCSLTFTGETASLSFLAEKTNARMTPVIENGQVVNVIIQNPGINYTVAQINVFGNGTGAVIEPNISIGDLNTRQANAELLAAPGSIEAIEMLNPGLNYVFANVVVDGDGVGCEAQAVIEEGVIKKIVVTNAGVGYTKATVTITGNELATQAYARAIVSPVEGHGKNAIKELFATDISLSSSIALDRNLGFIVDNDYRQLGIIKNPQEYSTTARFNGFSGSACFSITGDFVYQSVEEDMSMFDTQGNEYRVVAKPNDEPAGLVSLLVQSIDNKVPTIGTTLLYDENKQAIISIVTPPNVNKYSGDMLFVDNRNSFQPTEEQTLALKTVIKL